MEFHASGAFSTTATSRRATAACRSPTNNPAELHELMAATNTAAVADYAIWEDACRRLAADKRPAPASHAKSGPKTIIVVEHNVTLRSAMTAQLEAVGYRVISADGGANALAAANRQEAHMVITAIELPTMDGITLIGRLRELPTYFSTPIMMLTTDAHGEKKIAGRRAGASGWITKGCDPKKFVTIVQHVCPAN